MNKAILYKRILFLVGSCLVIIGSLLPWDCYQGYLDICFAGVNFNLPNLANGNVEAIATMVLISIGGGLIIFAINMIRQWRWEIISIFVTCVILYFSINIGGIYDNGGIIVIFLCCISLWGVFRLAHLTRRAILLVTISTTILIPVSIYHIVQVLPHLQPGLPIVFAGAILMIVTHRSAVISPS